MCIADYWNVNPAVLSWIWCLLSGRHEYHHSCHFGVRYIPSSLASPWTSSDSLCCFSNWSTYVLHQSTEGGCRCPSRGIYLLAPRKELLFTHHTGAVLQLCCLLLNAQLPGMCTLAWLCCSHTIFLAKSLQHVYPLQVKILIYTPQEALSINVSETTFSSVSSRKLLDLPKPSYAR